MRLTSCVAVGKRLKFQKVVLVTSDKYFIAFSSVVISVSFNLYVIVSIENLINGHDSPDHTNHHICCLSSVQ
jgi:hypothetical protein